MQSTGFSNASSQIRNDSLSRFSSVTTGTPAKRITFYKSGDTQFSGIRMPIHKRSFKCFDALLDDLSHKMPLPFGVRTITTPRGTRAIQSLEQLQDGACYLCSDRHYVKPIDMEAAGKRPAVWHHSYPLNTPRKPSRPEGPPTGQHYHRQPKRIVLVKNNDPAVRRSIVLSRKRARSLQVFMEEISELMQCHVRKLYTLEGRKIDSIQSLMQCPSVLVCVGREPFRPLLLENLRKNLEEKLPGIAARSHSSIYSEGHESKKNVNFGLETKKSIIHPRSDSSNKSTRFSLSSEKSYPNGSGMTPGQLGCITKEVCMNDDVEKRVLVNKDGSLSVEMKVRFRLVNDETLQWSTEIKKLPASTNECSSLQEGDPQCLQGKVVYSEPDSTTEYEAEEACSPSNQQMDFIESYCQNCCNHSKGYDIWKNPLHRDDGSSGTRSSSNSAGSSDKIIHQKASVDSVYTISRSSEEHTEHIVEKASCFQQTIKEGDTRIEYCSISCCCSQNEVSTSNAKCNIPTDTCESNTGKVCHHNDNRKTDYAVFDHLSKVTKVEEYLIPATSNSTINQSFKKDENDDYNELSPSISRASRCCLDQDKQFTCVHNYGRQWQQNLYSSSIPPKVSSCSADAVKSKIYKTMYVEPEVPQEGHADTDSMDSARSSVSKVSSRSQCCCCSQCREAVISLVESDMDSGLKERVQNSLSDDSKVSNQSQARTASPRTVISDSCAQKACQEETKSWHRSISAMSTTTGFSVKSTVCPCCGGCGRLISTIPADVHGTPVQGAEEDGEVKLLSPRSSKSPGSERANKCTHCALQSDSAISNKVENIDPVQNNIAEVEVRHACSQNALFDFSNCSAASKQSNNSKKPAYGRSSIAENISGNAGVEDVEERTKSTISVKSVGSEKTNNDIPVQRTTFGPENQIAGEIGTLSMARENITETENEMQDSEMVGEGRVLSAMSTKTHSSKDSEKSHKSDNIQDSATASTSPIADTPHAKIHSERSEIALSKSAKVSVKSNACLEEDLESVLNPIDMCGVQETRQTTDDAEYSAQISLPVALPSPKSSIMVEENDQALHVTSVNSKATSKSTRSNKHRCSSSRCVQRLAKSPSGKSKPLALHGLLDEPLSPTSTASVSLGLGAEERSEDLNEQSMSNISQTCDEPRCLSEKYTSEPSALDHTINNSGKLSAHGAATPKDQCSTKSKERSSSNLNLKEATKTNCNSVASTISLKASKSGKKPSPRNKYVAKSEMSQNCTTPDSERDSVLPHSPDLLREKNTPAKPDSKLSRSNTTDKNCGLEEMQQIDSKCKNSSSCKQRKISVTSQNKSEDCSEGPLVPFALPNASPTDVINDWLKNIPTDGPMYEMEDEFSEQHDETLLHIPAVKREGCFQNEIGEQSEKPVKMKESQEIGGLECADPVTEDKNTICDAKLACNEIFQSIAVNSDCSHLSPKLSKRESLKNCQSSIQVMKVLLTPKLDRCNSLPEVSPTYGRKLSTSAKGLLDCLANLQLIDPDPKIYDKYSEIISTLQSLWMNRPSEAVQDKHKIKVHSAEDEFNQRSSSGVDLSSGSMGSGKGSIGGGLENSDRGQGRMTLIAEQTGFPQIQGDVMPPENINTSIVSSDPITPDIAERVRCSPENEKLNKEAQKGTEFKDTDDVLNTNEHIKDNKERASTFFTRTSENNRNVKSVADIETYPPENGYSRTQPSDQKGQLTKRISQDPDPVWVLSLLKKLEKQFMSHYANAIAEFKVRWDLNDNETLDLMISELKEEVHKRIQSTINRELQKIQSRAGRTPRPPVSMLSTDSPVQTEQRRRRLKVMQNKLINPSRNEDVNTASGTDFSDQRSEDEYCPCDTCVKRKMASRVVQCAEALSVAPVLKEFDLRKILQTKKDPPVTMPVQSKLDEQKDQTEDSDSSNVQGKNNFEVVNEEATVHIIQSQIDEDDTLMKAETKDNIKTEHGIEACENQDKNIGVINEGWRTLKEGPPDDKGDGQPAQEKMFHNNVDGADDGESKTEREGQEVSTDKQEEEVMNTEDKEAEEAKEGGTTADEEVAMEKDPPDEVAVVERKKSSEIEEGAGNPVEEKESNDERAEEEASEGETNKESETGDAEEEERDDIEEKAEIPEEGEETENRAGEETRSSREGKTSEDESEEAENSTATSDERKQDDAPAAAAEPKPRKNETAQIIEGEKAEEDGTTSEVSEAEMSTENNADENQSESTGAENGVEKELHERQGKTYIQKPTKRKDSISVPGPLVSEEDDGDQVDVYDCGTDEKQTDIKAESIENQAESPDHPSQICDSDCKLITQITKTSVESQTGSLEYSTDLTVKKKLQNIQSFMESLSDQES